MPITKQILVVELVQNVEMTGAWSAAKHSVAVALIVCGVSLFC